MVRPKKSGRVTDPQTTSQQGAPAASYQIPSLRKRKPFVFWCVILGVVAMVFSVVYTFVLAIGSQ